MKLKRIKILARDFSLRKAGENPKKGLFPRKKVSLVDIR